jgi:hypothetical protein
VATASPQARQSAADNRNFVAMQLSISSADRPEAITSGGSSKSTLAHEARLGEILTATPVSGLDRRPVLFETL